MLAWHGVHARAPAARRPGGGCAICDTRAIEIAIPLYDGFTALDAVGPYEVLSRLPDATVRFVGVEPGPKTADTGYLTMVAECALDDLADPDVIVVPGGPGARRHLDDEALLGWLRAAHERSRLTTSVCTGALLLGAAGILDGLEATTHWTALAELDGFGARPSDRRVVEEGKVITAAGVSAGIDMALVLAARLGGDQIAEEIQLWIEYDPQPPFDGGSTAKAGPELVAQVRAKLERARASTGADVASPS